MNKKLPAILFAAVLFANLISWQPAAATNPPILITEVQTGFIDANGVEAPRSEFIELSNVSGNAVNLTGWRLEYLSAANDGSGAATQIIDTISGQISINGHGIWEHEGYYPIMPDSIFGVGDTSSSGFLAKTGGHVRLMNGTTMIDCVSWGSAVAINGCDKVSSPPPAGYTIQRRLTNNTYDKSAGVVNLTPPTPQGNNIYSTSVTAPVIPPPTNPIATTPEPTCTGVQLSEVLANPAGDDALGEFIELYNPTTQSQSLYGCSLTLSSGKKYTFSVNDSLAAGEYKAFSYTITGLQLSNSGAAVNLLTVDGTSSTIYPEVSDDQAWALINGVWYITNQPTPNSANVLTQTTGTSSITDTALTDLAPCPEGKYRNPDTNRCRNIVETTQATCPTGQERNPSTGRCRKITATTAQTACNSDQERNPVTNRCRKIAAAATTKACDPGQERNPTTGRCRKTTTTSGKVLAAHASSPKAYHYAIIGTILTSCAGYAGYEYRHEAAHFFTRLRKRQKVS